MDVDVRAGIGLPELLHGGIRFNISRAHYDFSLGGWPEQNRFSVSANYAHHFGNKWKTDLTPQPPWYMSWGGTYLFYRTDFIESHDVIFNARMGRDFNILRSLSISVSLGIGATVYHDKFELQSSNNSYDIYFPILPSGQFTIAYTFLKDISDKED
ncbi:MAG: hypothetical protein R2780_04925 [Crocinitomicaceae bacterium]|nr:hypothetical protein [Crocinitomicaceae bacterium]